MSSNDDIQNNIKYHNIGENSVNPNSLLKDSKNLLSLHTKLIHSNDQKESPNLPPGVPNKIGKIPVFRNLDHPYRCALCQLSFSTQGFLERHIKCIHPNGKNAIKSKCHICDKTFLPSDGLLMKKHIDCAHKDQFFHHHKCDFCSETFTNSEELISHGLKSHKFRHICHICDGYFPTEDALTEHKDYFHNDLKSHKCDTCSAYFSTPQTLKIHKKIHLLPTKDVRFFYKTSQKKLYFPFSRQHLNFQIQILILFWHQNGFR